MTALWPANEQSIMIHEICAAYSSVVVLLNKDYCHMLTYNPYNHQNMPLWTADSRYNYGSRITKLEFSIRFIACSEH